MALPPIATVADLEAWTGEEIPPEASPSEYARAEALLAAASTLVRTETGSAWVDADGNLVWVGTDDTKLVLVGEALTQAVVAAAARALSNPDGVITETLGSYTYRRGEEAAQGLYLTEEERRSIDAAVAVYRGTASPGLWTLPTTRGDIDTSSLYIPVAGSDKPIPADTPL